MQQAPAKAIEIQSAPDLKHQYAGAQPNTVQLARFRAEFMLDSGVQMQFWLSRAQARLIQPGMCGKLFWRKETFLNFIVEESSKILYNNKQSGKSEGTENERWTN